MLCHCGASVGAGASVLVWRFLNEMHTVERRLLIADLASRGLEDHARTLDTEQSVVVLPLVTPIRPGGGGTALLRGSHKHIGRWLASRGRVFNAGKKIWIMVSLIRVVVRRLRVS